MQSHRKITIPMMKSCIILLLLCAAPFIARADDALTIEIESDELMKTGGDLEQAETKDASATEIIKQIRKVNADGTYTIGFEADDGTFKIETRDLLGNVKQGTYGYIDGNGEVKRVSYTTQNSTLYKEQPSAEVAKEDEDKESINLAQSQRYNRTFQATTRRPSSLSYLTSTPGSPTLKPSVIQSIPKRRILLPSDKANLRSHLDTSKQPFEGTTTLVYATSVPTPKPYASRSTTSPNYSVKILDRSDKVEIDQVERKVFIATPRESTTMKAIQPKEKGEEKVEQQPKRGNALRRQLKASDGDETIEAQQQVLYGGGDESSAIYGGGFGNVRPLFTTTSQPKIPLQVLAARARATQLQSVLANSPTTTTEKSYSKIPKRQSPKLKVEEATESVTELVEQIQATEPEGGAIDERRSFQRPLPPQLEGLYRPRNYLRQLQQQQQQQQQQQPLPQDPRINYRLPPPGSASANSPNPDLRQPAAQRFVQQYQQPQLAGYGDQSGENYGQQSSLFPPQRSNYDLDRPLTVRDFERLLQLLVFRQQQPPQQPYRINPFYPPSNPQSYAPFIPGGGGGYNQQPYSQIPRPPFFNPVSSGLYDPGFQNPYYSPSTPAVSQQYPNSGTQVPNDAMYQTQQPLDSNYELQRLMPRRRPYDPRMYGQQTQMQSPPVAPSEQEYNYNSLQSQLSENYLPPSVREQLLYRMLMLAIRSESQFSPAPAASSDSPTIHTSLEPEQQEATNIPSVSTPSKKPVRSVQILGEENE